jgi:hypothetical protein
MLLILTGCQKDDNPVSSSNEIPAPTALSVSARATSENYSDITVSWSYSKENMERIEGFQVEEQTGESQRFYLVSTVRGSRSVILDQEQRRQNYGFRVRAFNGNLYSAYTREQRIYLP